MSGRLPTPNKQLLSKVLKYKNPEVVARFCKEQGVSKKNATVIFKDLLRFLWLSNRKHYLNSKRKDQVYDLHPFPMLFAFVIVDEMWHTFILFTGDYVNFCQKYFRKSILHHVPESIHKHDRNSKVVDHEQIRKKANDLIRFVSSELGESVARRWFVNYPREYSLAKIRKSKYVASGTDAMLIRQQKAQKAA